MLVLVASVVRLRSMARGPQDMLLTSRLGSQSRKSPRSADVMLSWAMLLIMVVLGWGPESALQSKLAQGPVGTLVGGFVSAVFVRALASSAANTVVEELVED